MTINSSSNNNSLQLLDWVANAGIDGFGILPPAKKVAEDHRAETSSVEDAIDSVIQWRTIHTMGTGFVTGLGGIATLPISIPASMAASYALAANTAAAIAHLRGHDIHSDQVRSMILLCLLGGAGEIILREAGIRIGSNVFKGLIRQIPGKVLIEINKKVGFRLVTKAGEKGVVNLMKLVPIAGGIVGGTIDGFFVNTCGNTAKRIFQ